MSGRYDVALICKNGHVVNASSIQYPAHNSKYCDICGSKTIDKCINCGSNIRGEYHVDGFFGSSTYKPPSYCYNCGEGYPWTKTKIEALKETVQLMDELNEEEKQELIDSAKDVTTENPKTKLGALKIKKLSKKIGNEIWGAARDIIVDISSETAKKIIQGE